MNKVKSKSRKYISILLVIFFSSTQLINAQTPTKCLEIESILVDACIDNTACPLPGPGSREGENEMLRFKIGPSPINISDITITWPSNPFKGISAANAITGALVSTLNATIQSCGLLKEPVGGVLPAGKTVLLITSTDMCTAANSFANLSDTLYVIFQIAGNTGGHFGNYSLPAAIRTTIIKQISINCSDTAKYDRALLKNQAGLPGAQDGAAVDYAWNGTPTYFNNGCQAPYSLITANAGANVNICPSGTIALNGSATGSYSSVIWQGGHGVISSPGSLTTNYTASAAESGNVTLSLGVIGFCTDTVFSFVTITINPTPDMTSVDTATICSGSVVNLPFTSSVASTYSWIASDNANISGESLSAQTANTLNDVLTNTGTSPEIVSYTVTPTSTVGLCPGIPQTVNVTVNPTPAVSNSPLTQAFCSGGSTAFVTLSGNVAGANFTWTASATIGITGFSTSGTDSIPVQTLSNSASTSGTVTYAITPTANSCQGAVTNYIVTVDPKDDASFTYASSTFCQTGTNPSPVITGLPGGIFSSGPDLSINSSTGEINLPGSLLGTYAVTYSVNVACPDSSVFNVTLTTSPNASFSFSGPYCQNEANPSPAFPTGASAGIFSSTPAGLIFVNTTTGQIDLAASAAGTYTIKDSIAAAGGCGVAIATNTVTISPTPTLTTSPLSKTICSGDNTSITLTSGISGTTFDFTASSSSGALTGFTASGTGISTINDVLTNSSALIETITYVITPKTVSCTGIPVNYVVTVNPVPGITNTPLTATICSGVNTNIALTSGVSGTTFDYSASNTSGLVTGFTTSATGISSINDVLTNNSVSADSVSYLITPKANGCAGTQSAYVVHVNPVPNLTNSPLSETICSGGNTNIALTSGISGTSFDYSASNSSGMISGYTPVANGISTINDILNSVSSSIDSVTYLITPNANGCAGFQSTYVVRVFPIPTVTNTSLSELICSGGITAGLTPTSDVSGTTYTWTATGTSGISGFSASGINVIPAQTISTTGTTAGTVTYSIIPSANTCTGIATDYVVTVNPIPAITNTTLSETICSGGITTGLILTADITGTTYTWAATGTPGITGFMANGINDLPAQTISTSGTSAGTVTYVITPSANSCTGTAINYVITVYPSLTAIATNNSPICEGDTLFLSTATVAFATYNWTGPNSFTSTDQNPVITNTTTTMSGIYSLKVSLGTCTSPIATTVVTVNAVTTASFSANPTSGAPPLTVNFSNNSQNANTYLWDFGNSATNTSADPTEVFTLIGDYNVVLIASTNSQCPDTTEMTITVFDNFSLQIPNVFTPNGDGKNESFSIIGTGIKEFECSIFDRWGVKMTELKEINAAWDGRTTSGLSATSGTYFYIMKVTGYDDNPIERAGSVLLIK